MIYLSGCHPNRFLSESETRLHSVRVVSETKQVRASDFRHYVRQEPNTRWFGFARVPMSVYCLSPADTTQRRGRFFRKVGEAPVVFDSVLTESSRKILETALRAKGFLHASVVAKTNTQGRKTDVIYHLRPNHRYYINSICREFDDETVRACVESTDGVSLLRTGMPLDIGLLSEERTRIVALLQNAGFYRLNKDFVSYRVDTLCDDTSVALTLRVVRPVGIDSQKVYERFRFRNVTLYEHGEQETKIKSIDNATKGSFPLQIDSLEEDTTLGYGRDTLRLVPKHRPFQVEKSKKRFRDNSESLHQIAGIRPSVLLGHMPLRPDSLYREHELQAAYAGLNSLSALSYSTIRLREVPTDTAALLDADVAIVRNKPYFLGAEVEGTNTNGDLGVALSLTFSNRNLFRGSEVLSLKVRGAYEAITGLEGYSDENYFEYGAELGLRFPARRIPFTSSRSYRTLHAVSDLRFMYDSQNRPEFHRRVLTGNWSLRWEQISRPRLRHRIDLLNLNYIFMPWISPTFRKDYLDGEDPRYSLLRSTYDNLFILSSGYSFVYNSTQDRERPQGATGMGTSNAPVRGWQLRFSIETAGNLLYALSKISGAHRHDGMYHYLNNSYSQYVRTEIDYSQLLPVSERNTLALHAYLGIALPYGNASVIPYEKRFFSGGANSVRGWSVRGLGPGSYRGRDGKVDFINQTGNIKLDFSAEWRTHLIWKLDGALFIDAGNVWTTRYSEQQEGGRFRIQDFYRQIAVAYGLGIRFNLDYFILRFDAGMKAVNPSYSNVRQHFPLIYPRLSRDFAFHFAVGLPF